MKVIVTGSKVYAAGKDGKGSEPIAIGTEIEIEGDVIPGYLVGKVREPEPEPEPEKVAVTNPKK